MSTDRPSDIQAQILEAATHLMAARGEAGTSLQDVADAVGLKKPSILYHFPSKDALRKAVIDGLLARWTELLPRLLLSGHADPRSRFDAVFGELVDFFGDDPDRARLLVRELLDRPVEMERYLAQRVEPWLKVVVLALDSGKARGVVRADLDARAFTLVITTLLLSGLATFDALTALFGGDAKAARQRVVTELSRIAQSALFPS